MSSTCSSTGSYTLTVTFEVGTDIDKARSVPFGVAIAAQAPSGGPAAGSQHQEAIDQHHHGRGAHLAEGDSRQPLPEQLCDPADQGYPQPDLRGRRYHGLRRRQLRDAGLDRSRAAQGTQHDDRGRARGHRRAERPGCRRPDRPGPLARGPELPVHRDHARPVEQPRAVRRDHRQDGRGRHRPDAPDPDQGRCADRARGPDLRPHRCDQRRDAQAGRNAPLTCGRHRHGKAPSTAASTPSTTAPRPPTRPSSD